jgi:hypothetical protein
MAERGVLITSAIFMSIVTEDTLQPGRACRLAALTRLLSIAYALSMSPIALRIDETKNAIVDHTLDCLWAEPE